MVDLARIHFVSGRIPQLYGLTALPWCAYGAVDLAWHLDWLSWIPRNGVLTGGGYALGGAVLALAGDVWIRRRYVALYGRVMFASRRRRAATAVSMLLVLLAYIALSGVSRRIHGPDLGMLFLSACCWYVACRQRPYRPHYAILAGAAIALSGLIWTGLPRTVLYAIYQFAFIGGLAIAGIGDHLLLARTAPPVPPPPRAPADEPSPAVASAGPASREDSHAHAI